MTDFQSLLFVLVFTFFYKQLEGIKNRIDEIERNIGIKKEKNSFLEILKDGAFWGMLFEWVGKFLIIPALLIGAFIYAFYRVLNQAP